MSGSYRRTEKKSSGWSGNTGSARSVGKAFFPLDEELGLGAERLTPHAHECLMRFGTWMPFQKAAAELAFSLCVVVSEPTARRYAQAAGEAYVDWQTVEVERLSVYSHVNQRGAWQGRPSRRGGGLHSREVGQFKSGRGRVLGI